MESPWTPHENIKVILAWAVALTAMVAAVASAETVRDWIAPGRGEYEVHVVQYASFQAEWALKEIESLRREIKRTKLQMDEAKDHGASPTTLAVYQELIDGYEQEIADLRERRK